MVSRYLIRGITSQFILVFVIINLMVFVSQLMRLSEALVAIGITPENVILPVLFVLLPATSITIPTALLFATMLALSRLNLRGELVALLASGYSLFRIFRVVFIFSLLFYLLTLVCTFWLEPWGRREFVVFFYHKTRLAMASTIKSGLREGVFFSGFPGFVFNATKISADRQRYQDVIFAPRSRQRDSFFLIAKKGWIEGSVAQGDLYLVFEDGAVYANNMRDKQVLKFDLWKIDILKIFQELVVGKKIGFDYRTYYPTQLVQQMKKLEDSGDVSLLPAMRLLLHRRLGRPFLTLVFAILGMFLGVYQLRCGRNLSFLYAVVAVIVCFSVVGSLDWLAKQQLLSAPLAVWIPNIFIGLIATFLIWRKSTIPLGEPLLKSVLARRVLIKKLK